MYISREALDSTLNSKIVSHSVNVNTADRGGIFVSTARARLV